MQAAGVLKQTEITIVLSGDEEAHGEPASISRRDMIAAAHHSDVALEFEGTPRMDGVFYGSISRRSSITWHINTTGETGHSSGIFSVHMGFGAIYELTRILDAFRTQLPEENLTFNIGMIVGGTSVHVDEAGNNATATGKDNVIAPSRLRQRRYPHHLQPADRASREKDAGDRRTSSAEDHGGHHLRRRLSGHGAHRAEPRPARHS